MPNHQGNPDSSEYAKMGVTIVAGKPFEDCIKDGVPDTPQMRSAFEQLKKEIADIKARGRQPDFQFD